MRIQCFIQGGNACCPFFVRVGFNFGAGFADADLGYLFNVYSIDPIDGNIATPVGISGLYCGPRVGIRIANLFYAAAGVRWMQKNTAEVGSYKYVLRNEELVLATSKKPVFAATLSLGICF